MPGERRGSLTPASVDADRCTSPVTARSPPGRERPRAVQPTCAGAPTRGLPIGWSDPPLVDLRALACVTTNPHCPSKPRRDSAGNALFRPVDRADPALLPSTHPPGPKPGSICRPSDLGRRTGLRLRSRGPVCRLPGSVASTAPHRLPDDGPAPTSTTDPKVGLRCRRALRPLPPLARPPLPEIGAPVCRLPGPVGTTAPFTLTRSPASSLDAARSSSGGIVGVPLRPRIGHLSAPHLRLPVGPALRSCVASRPIRIRSRLVDLARELRVPARKPLSVAPFSWPRLACAFRYG